VRCVLQGELQVKQGEQGKDGQFSANPPSHEWVHQDWKRKQPFLSGRNTIERVQEHSDRVGTETGGGRWGSSAEEVKTHLVFSTGQVGGQLRNQFRSTDCSRVLPEIQAKLRVVGLVGGEVGVEKGVEERRCVRLWEVGRDPAKEGNWTSCEAAAPPCHHHHHHSHHHHHHPHHHSLEFQVPPPPPSYFTQGRPIPPQPSTQLCCHPNTHSSWIVTSQRHHTTALATKMDLLRVERLTLASCFPAYPLFRMVKLHSPSDIVPWTMHSP
jgi:hypothetical protein